MTMISTVVDKPVHRWGTDRSSGAAACRHYVVWNAGLVRPLRAASEIRRLRLRDREQVVAETVAIVLGADRLEHLVFTLRQRLSMKSGSLKASGSSTLTAASSIL